VLALIALVGLVAVADSINPSTIAPALLLALGERRVGRVALFTLGVFLVSSAAGVVLVLGPGAALRGAVPHPGARTVHVSEIALGAVLLAGAAGLWRLRAVVARRLGRRGTTSGRREFLLGAGIMAVELPTAFPYFAALAAIVASRRAPAVEAGVVLLYNVIFVAPLLALIVTLVVAGPRGARTAAALRARLDRVAPALLPVVLLVIGSALVAVGVTGLVR